jgi:hypothetical protein
LRELDIATEDDDWNLPIPPMMNEVPKEWTNGWWLQKTKHDVRPEISQLFMHHVAEEFDDED